MNYLKYCAIIGLVALSGCGGITWNRVFSAEVRSCRASCAVNNAIGSDAMGTCIKTCDASAP